MAFGLLEILVFKCLVSLVHVFPLRSLSNTEEGEKQENEG
jgi:hypothetical protein